MTDAQILPLSTHAKGDEGSRSAWSMYLVTGFLTLLIAFAITGIVNNANQPADQVHTQKADKLDGRGKWSGYMQ